MDPSGLKFFFVEICLKLSLDIFYSVKAVINISTNCQEKDWPNISKIYSQSEIILLSEGKFRPFL